MGNIFMGVFIYIKKKKLLRLEFYIVNMVCICFFFLLSHAAVQGLIQCTITCFLRLNIRLYYIYISVYLYLYIYIKKKK